MSLGLSILFMSSRNGNPLMRQVDGQCRMGDNSSSLHLARHHIGFDLCKRATCRTNTRADYSPNAEVLRSVDRWGGIGQRFAHIRTPLTPMSILWVSSTAGV